MRVTPILVTSAIAVLLAGAARAEVSDDIRHANTGVGLSLVARHISYAEHNNGLLPGGPDTLDAETGWLPGARLDASYQLAGHSTDLLFGMSFQYASGTLDYDGGREQINGGTITYVPVKLTSNAKLYELGFVVGIPVAIADGVALTPLARYRHRQWSREIGDGVQGSYAEKYTHHELAVGALLQVVATQGFVLGADAAIGTTLSPNLNIDLGGAGIDVSLGMKPVFSGGLHADYALGRVHLRLDYEGRVFGYGTSPKTTIAGTTSTVQEPASSTTEHELRLGAMLTF